MLTQEILKDLLSYNPETGLCTWLKRDIKYFKTEKSFRQWNDRYAGTPANYINKQSGYLEIAVFHKKYQGHRLIWLLMTGELPKHVIDHRDTIKSNNIWTNLRDVTQAKNVENVTKARKHSKSKTLGVCKSNNSSRFRARLRVNKKEIHLGCFNTKEEAHNAYLDAKRLYHSSCTI